MIFFSYAAITIHVHDFRITKRPVWARVTQEVGQDVSGGALNSVGKGFSFAQTRPQMAEDQSIAIDRRWLRGNNFRKLKLYKMLSVRIQRCSRHEKGSRSVRVRWTDLEWARGVKVNNSFIWIKWTLYLKNVYNFRCKIQGFKDERAKSFDEVKWCDNKSCLSSFLYPHGSVN